MPPKARKRPLSQLDVDRAKPAEKPIRLYDDRGMYLEISPAGGKLWRLKYRINGKEKRLALGAYPDVTLKVARRNRDKARALIAEGIDPSARRQEEKRQIRAAATNSFESVANEWAAKQANIWSERHLASVKRRLERDLFPDLAEKPIDSITAPALLAVLEKISQRGAHDLAHRVMIVAGQVFRYGVRTGRCERDPTRDLRGALTPHERKNQNAVRAEELPELLNAIDGYDQIGGLQTKLALQLLAITFVRTTELINAKWSEFSELDIANPTWSIPAERMKMKREHLIPLAPQAVAILRQLKNLGGGSEYVLPGRNLDKPISNNTMLFALYRLGYKSRMTGHGFRAIASSVLHERGYRSDAIERQLAHADSNEVRAAYNRAEYLPERRQMMNEWASIIDEYLAKATKKKRGTNQPRPLSARSLQQVVPAGAPPGRRGPRT
ncbi:MAG: integrase [Betaproteobacteria bacterium]|nr:MAG: integrase [Betaproteobacteria bacterium]